MKRTLGCDASAAGAAAGARQSRAAQTANQRVMDFAAWFWIVRRKTFWRSGIFEFCIWVFDAEPATLIVSVWQLTTSAPATYGRMRASSFLHAKIVFPRKCA